MMMRVSRPAVAVAVVVVAIVWCALNRFPVKQKLDRTTVSSEEATCAFLTQDEKCPVRGM